MKHLSEQNVNPISHHILVFALELLCYYVLRKAFDTVSHNRGLSLPHLLSQH